MAYEPMSKMMTDNEKADAYDDLRTRAAEMGYACIGYALDELEDFLRETPVRPSQAA